MTPPLASNPAYAAGLDELAEMQASAAVAFARQARVLCELVEMSTRDGWRSSAPFEVVLMEVAGTCVIGQSTAHSRLVDAEHLVTRLRQTLGRLEAGTLGVPQARVLVGETRDLDEATCRQVEDRVLPDAAELPPGALRARVRRAVLTLDAAAAARRAAKARGDRRVWVRQAQEDGMSLLMALIPSEQVCAVMLGLTEQARALKAAHDDGRTADQLRTDLLVELLTGERVAPACAGVPAVQAEPQGVTTGEQGEADAEAAAPAAGDSPFGRVGEAAHAPPAAQPTTAATTEPAASSSEPAGSGSDDATRPPSPPTAAPPALDPPNRVVVVRPSQVVIHVPLATALGVSDEPGSIQGGDLLSAPQVRELMVAAELRALFVDAATGEPITARKEPLHRAAPGGGPLSAAELRNVLRNLVLTPVPEPADVAEPQHDPSAELARFVRLRDQRCDGPGCSVPASRCELDHHDPYPAGPTSRRNLRTRSQRCHHAKHHGFTVVNAADGTTRWTGPSARTYRVHPRWQAPPEVKPGVRLVAPAAQAAWDRHLLSRREPTGRSPDQDPPPRS